MAEDIKKEVGNDYNGKEDFEIDVKNKDGFIEPWASEIEEENVPKVGTFQN
ncbi:4265_t:CDS:2 [Gigaspora margarita]|uniref:4265_t:CDS:1 n=1 Tax=Gigaspora margarita TaxID=4874 RepID=A0ABN7V846_GIGMA|nr:4265_t:CDS:2 [Gigaspora margarita]